MIKLILSFHKNGYKLYKIGIRLYHLIFISPNYSRWTSLRSGDFAAFDCPILNDFTLPKPLLFAIYIFLYILSYLGSKGFPAIYRILSGLILVNPHQRKYLFYHIEAFCYHIFRVLYSSHSKAILFLHFDKIFRHRLRKR